MARSIINEIPGIPCDENGDRLYLLTSWTREGIEAAREKARELTDEGQIRGFSLISTHYGESGMQGDEWFSSTVRLPMLGAEGGKGEQIADRYGLRRWVWTEDEE